MSWFSDIISPVTNTVSNLLGGGGSGASASASATSDINFKPTTNINFDVEGLKNAYADGSQTIANAFSSATQSQINFDRNMNTKLMEQDRNLFNQSYEQNSSLNSALISSDTNIATTAAQIESAKLQNDILFNTELLKLEDKKSKQVALFLTIALGAYLYKNRKKGKK